MRSKKILGLVGVLLLGVAVYLVHQVMNPPENPEAPHENETALATRTERSERDPSTVELLERARAEKPPTERQKALARLKEQWKVLQPKGNSVVREQDALARESCALLGCSAEAIELMAWLDEIGMGYGGGGIEIGLKNALKSPDAAEQRALLAGLPGHPPNSGRDGHYLIQSLCNAAGQGCSQEDFEEFYHALQNEAYAQEARLGRNLRLMRSDPKRGVLDTLEILQSDVHSLTKKDHLSRQFGEELPAGVDFGELERLIPVEDGPLSDAPSDWSPNEWARHMLFRAWGKKGSNGATEYVLENPERIDPRFLRTVAAVRPYGHMKWVQQIPEGEYYDQAALGAVRELMMRNPSDARMLAPTIGDPKLREEALKIANPPQSDREIRN